MDRIYYRRLKKKKYRLTEVFREFLSPLPLPVSWIAIRIKNESGETVGSLYDSGLIVLREGYEWDGPSGPTFDTPSGMAGSAIHDAGYQLIENGLLGYNDRSRAIWRKWIDKEFRKQLKKSGMWAFRRWYYYKGVKNFGRRHAMPGANDEYDMIYSAP